MLFETGWPGNASFDKVAFKYRPAGGDGVGWVTWISGEIAFEAEGTASAKV